MTAINAEERDRERLRRRFPSQHARIVADRAVDALPADAPMSSYVDAWLAAYRAAGGKEGR